MSGHAVDAAKSTLMTDAVEKRFCWPLQARLIQDQLGVRNIDSRDRPTRFDCCAFLFYSFYAVTFSTASTLTGLLADSGQFRFAPRTCRPVCGSLTLEQPPRRRRSVAWGPLLGLGRLDGRHQTARVHLAARRRVGVADGSARAAARADAADRGGDGLRRERSEWGTAS